MRKPPTTPIAGRSDAAIEKRAHDLTHLVETITHVPQDAASLASALAQPGVFTHDTHLTDASPIQPGASRGVTYAERARAMGGATSEAASYEVTTDGPQGSPESLKARRNLIAIALSEVLQARRERPRTGLPGSKAERRANRARNHQRR